MKNNLKNLRESAGLTQIQAADLMGMSKGGYIKIEHGHRRLTAEHIARAAEIFEVSQETVLTGWQKPPAKRSAAETAKFFKSAENFDRYFAVLEGLLEGLGISRDQAAELKPMYLEAIEADFDDLEETADFEARRALARFLVNRYATTLQLPPIKKSPPK